MSKLEQNPPLLNNPMAIVIAGALIALAIYMSGGIGARNADRQASGADPAPTVNPQAGNPEPAQPAIGDIREVTKDDHIKGAENAKVTIIEYSDVECSFCKRFHPTMNQLVEEYPNDVRWVYRHFVLGRFPNSNQIAMATECAGEQGKFWEVADVVLDANKTTDPAELSNIARAAGVPNMSQFETCMEEEKYAERIQEDTADARVAGGRGTPYSVVIGPDGEKLPLSGAQPYSAVKQLVDQLLDN